MTHGAPEQSDLDRASYNAWQANSARWDEAMSEGNRYANELVWPACRELLEDVNGRQVLDLACGNGLFARRLAALGADVLGIDFAENMIERARARSRGTERVRFCVGDITDPELPARLGGRFDAALCSMALFDIRHIGGVFQTATRWLRPRGRLVFAVLHPCFNNPSISLISHTSPHGDAGRSEVGVLVRRYKSTFTVTDRAMSGMEPQPVVHRPLEALLGAAFVRGLVLDALREPSFSDTADAGHSVRWDGRFSELPPILVCRLRAR